MTHTKGRINAPACVPAEIMGELRSALKALPPEHLLVVIVERRGEEYTCRHGQRTLEEEVVRVMTKRPEKGRGR